MVGGKQNFKHTMIPYFKIIFVLCACLVVCDSKMYRREIYMTVPQLISSSGYPVETHRVRTLDGYILQMHRIPAGRRSSRMIGSARKGKKAVLLVHGLMGCSSNFIIMGPKRSLGYILADAGYDVWLGNLRGNRNTAHETLTRTNPEFWAFSLDEHGKYDAPAMIDKILNVTGLDKVLYIGHSMGATTFFTMMSQRPEYNDKIVAFIALAPGVYMDNVRFVSNFFLKTIDVFNTLRAAGIVWLGIDPEVIEFVVNRFCDMRQPRPDLCMRLLYSAVGEDYEQNDWELMPVIMASGQPVSLRQLEHFGKIAMTGVFTEWENGINGPVKPHNISRVAVPVTLLYGENDQMTEKRQILRVAEQLNASGVLEAYRPGCSWPKFNHLDFLFAKDVGNLISKPLVEYVDMLYNKYGSN